MAHDGSKTADNFHKARSDVDSPAEFAYTIPDMHTGGAHTTVEVGVLSKTTRALYVGVAGNVFCRLANSFNGVGYDDTEQANVHFQNVPAGTILPIRVQAIFANNRSNDTQNTTATGLIGLY